MSRLNARDTRNNPRPEPWDDVLAATLDDRLENAARTLANLSAHGRGVAGRSRSFGLLPAVYFPRLRMGSVVYARWGRAAREVRRAFPWNPRYVPPPFTCFVPPVARDDRAFLITDVARIVDELGPGTDIESLRRMAVRPRAKRHIAESAPLRACVGTSSWTRRDGAASIVDAYLLAASGVQATTCIYAVPSLEEVPGYVPLLYVQSDTAYEHEALERTISRALTTVDPAFVPLQDAMRATIDAARLCATRWINPKSGLLSRTGFDALKDDLTRRVGADEMYAECFFDIDGFKAMNDQLGYDGADRVAAEVADRVLLFVQRDAASEYAEHRAGRRRTPPNGIRALLAHVSGDEYKCFVQTTGVRRTMRPAPAARPRRNAALQRLARFATGVVTAASTTSDQSATDAWARRHAAAFARTRYGRGLPRHTPDVSVSLGIALLDPGRRAPTRHATRPYPITDAALAPYRRGIDELEPLVERGLDGAKYDAKHGGRHIMFSDEVLFNGGRIVDDSEHVDAGHVRISLGGTDGVRIGSTFRVIDASAARIRVVTVRERDADARVVSHRSNTKVGKARIELIDGGGLPTEYRTGAPTERVLGTIPRGGPRRRR